jgi:hypothetical protein
METTHIEGGQPRKAALTSLAIVGFVALIIIGILATIYAASFIPKMLSRSGSASAYLSTLNDTPTTADTTPAPTATTPAVTATPLTPTETPAQPQTVTKTVYRNVYVPTPVTPSYSGLADLTITVTDKGYLRNGNTGSFVSSSYVPSGYQGAVKYRVTNTGNNVSNSYRVDIRVESGNGTDNDSVSGGTLPPNRSVEGIGSFDVTTGGTAYIRLTVDAGNNVVEENENNNTDSTSMSVNGGSNYNNNSSYYDSNGNYCSNGTYYSGNRYYCNSSSNYNNNNSDWYDSTGAYCGYGTYSQNGRTYCRPYTSTNSYYNDRNYYGNNYDSNGNYCAYGVYESGNRLYCNSSNSNTNVYNYNRDSGCIYGTYVNNGTYYCN